MGIVIYFAVVLLIVFATFGIATHTRVDRMEKPGSVKVSSTPDTNWKCAHCRRPVNMFRFNGLRLRTVVLYCEPCDEAEQANPDKRQDRHRGESYAIVTPELREYLASEYLRTRRVRS